MLKLGTDDDEIIRRSYIKELRVFEGGLVSSNAGGGYSVSYYYDRLTVAPTDTLGLFLHKPGARRIISEIHEKLFDDELYAHTGRECREHRFFTAIPCGRIVCPVVIGYIDRLFEFYEHEEDTTQTDLGLRDFICAEAIRLEHPIILKRS